FVLRTFSFFCQQVFVQVKKKSGASRHCPRKALGNGARLVCGAPAAAIGASGTLRSFHHGLAFGGAAAGPSDTAALPGQCRDAPKEILYSGLTPFRFASNGLVGLRCLQKQLEHTARDQVSHPSTL